LQATVSCAFFTATYVGSLYLWRNEQKRDHPETIKRRFISVGLTCIISSLYILFFWPNYISWEINGIHTKSLLLAATLPLLLTMILFLGPLALLFFDPPLREPIFHFGRLIWWRNFIVVGVIKWSIFLDSIGSFN
jgi:uncharacterized membrane protein